MNTASLKLSKELYELSGWKTFPIGYCIEKDCEYDSWIEEGWCPSCSVANGEMVGAYDLGFLLRKLPHEIPANGDGRPCVLHIEPDWFAGYVLDNDYVEASGVDDDSAENAICKLAIELFKQGVLEK